METRDRRESPSINFPQTKAEARRAVWLHTANWVAGERFGPHTPYTTDAGFGLKRTEEQAKWLEEARLDMIIELNATLIRLRDSSSF